MWFFSCVALLALWQHQCFILLLYFMLFTSSDLIMCLTEVDVLSWLFCAEEESKDYSCFKEWAQSLKHKVWVHRKQAVWRYNILDIVHIVDLIKSDHKQKGMSAFISEIRKNCSIWALTPVFTLISNLLDAAASTPLSSCASLIPQLIAGGSDWYRDVYLGTWKGYRIKDSSLWEIWLDPGN